MIFRASDVSWLEVREVSMALVLSLTFVQTHLSQIRLKNSKNIRSMLSTTFYRLPTSMVTQIREFQFCLSQPGLLYFGCHIFQAINLRNPKARKIHDWPLAM